MRCYKTINDDYLSMVGIGNGGEEITEAEYNRIKAIIDNRPTAPDGFAYRLTTELEWELYELPPMEEDEEVTAEDYEAALAEMGVTL